MDLRPFFWSAADCRILETGKNADSGSASKVLYQYKFNGQSYTSLQVFIDVPLNRKQRRAKYSIDVEPVSSLQVGQSISCYVNSSNPEEAVLYRVEPWYGFIACFPLLFVFVGLLNAASAFYAPKDLPLSGAHQLRRASGLFSKMKGGSSIETLRAIPDSANDLVFRSSSSRFGKVLVLLLLTLFWNGIVSVFVYHLFQEFSIFLGLFLTPFVLIGLVLIFAFFHGVLSLWNPSVQLKLDTQPRLGTRSNLSWQLSGRVERVQELVISLEGKEEVRYRRGTNTHHDSRVFQKIEIARLSTNQLRQLSSGASFSVPKETIPTFNAANNSICWYLSVKGTIPNWPDMNDQFKVEILPD